MKKKKSIEETAAIRLLNEIGNRLLDEGYSVTKSLIKSVAIICIEKQIETEQKYSDFGEYDFLKQVENQIKKI